MSFGPKLIRLAEMFEQRALTEPDFDIEIRDEFIDYDESDEERIEKVDRKFHHYLEKKRKYEESKNRLRLGNEWGGIDHQELEQTVEETIIESKFLNSPTNRLEIGRVEIHGKVVVNTM